MADVEVLPVGEYEGVSDSSEDGTSYPNDPIRASVDPDGNIRLEWPGSHAGDGRLKRDPITGAYAGSWSATDPSKNRLSGTFEFSPAEHHEDGRWTMEGKYTYSPTLRGYKPGPHWWRNTLRPKGTED
jgi:hypothetical protein